MKVVSIIGTRPQILKLDKKLKQKVVFTGQHYDTLMKDVFFKGLKLPKPDYECGETELVPMVKKMIPILKKEKPDIVLVYGDCRTTLAGALAASELGIPIGHIEAGMRSYRPDMPEEKNRIVVDHLSTYNFVTDKDAEDNLAAEHITKNVFLVGNVMLDTFSDFCPIKKSKDYRKYSYLSIHRKENTESKVRLESIFEGLTGMGKFVFPVHPRTKKAIQDMGIKVPKNVQMIKPLSYKDNLSLVSNSKFVLTDSGGVQNEAYWMGVPCGLLRKETEWLGPLKDGWTTLLDADAFDIKTFLGKKFNPAHPRPSMPVYGAKTMIRQILKELYA